MWRHLELCSELCSSNWAAKVLAVEPVCQHKPTSGWHSWQEIAAFSLLVQHDNVAVWARTARWQWRLIPYIYNGQCNEQYINGFKLVSVKNGMLPSILS